jgi:hypothetical protein
MVPGKPDAQLVDTVLQQVGIRTPQGGPHLFKQLKEVQNLDLVLWSAGIKELGDRAGFQEWITKKEIPFFVHCTLSCNTRGTIIV